MKSVCDFCRTYKRIFKIIRFEEMVNHRYQCGRCWEKAMKTRKTFKPGVRPASRADFKPQHRKVV